MMNSEFDIWDNAIVPTIVQSFALPEEKDFQIWELGGDSIVPYIYDEAVTVTARRRVFIF
jgi:hypothetical protein